MKPIFKKSQHFKIDSSLSPHNRWNIFQNIFKISDRGSTIKKEIIGGISTFIAMAYILAVNPSIVGGSPVFDNQGNIIDYASSYQGGLFLVTVISSFIGTILMGLIANIPIALAPGMGLNAFFTYTVAQSVGFDSALTITIISGIIYFIVVVTPLRKKISTLIHNNIKLAIGAGIGFFIAFLGLQNSGIISVGSGTVTGLGDFKNPLIITATVMIFVTLALHYAKVPGSIMIALILGAIIVIGLVGTNQIKDFQLDDLLGSYGDFSKIADVAKGGWMGFANVQMWKSPITYMAIFSFVYMDFFDTTGTLISLSKTTNIDSYDRKWMNKANLVDAVSTISGAGIGATTVTSFVESIVGVTAGAKTGFANIITALLFAVAIAAWPVLQIFMPINGFQPVTSPILILIGTIMISQLRHFEWKITIDIPMMFMTIIFMMLSNSIADGIGFGAITFIVLNTCAGIVQKWFKHHRVDEMEIPLGEVNEKQMILKQEINYFKRINWMILFIGTYSLLYIILNTVF